jgi:PAS domain S-box-containing protein
MKQKSEENILSRILCLEDAPQDVDIIRELLTDAGYKLKMDWAATEKEFVSLLRKNKYDIILSDFRLPGFDAFGALRLSLEICPDIPFICVSGSIGEETAIDLIQQGAIDYILKDRLVRLPSAIKRALDEVKEKESRRRAEEKLQESEERYRLLFNSSMDAVLLTAPTGEIFSANPAACRILGRTEEEICAIGRKGVVDVTDPQVAIAIEERARTGKFIGEITMIRKDGTPFPAEISTALFKDKDGRDRSSMILRDITERKRTEETLHESEQSFRFLFKNNPLCMWVYDLKTLSFLAVNDAAVNKYGYTRDEFLSMTLKEIRPPEDIDLLMKDIAKERTSMQDSEGWRHRLKNGRIIIVEIISHTLDFEGRDAALVVALDITERQRAENALIKSEEKYRGIFENVQDVYYEASFDGTIIDISPSIGLISKGQYSRDDLIGKSIYDFYADPNIRQMLLAKLLEERRISDFEVVLKNKDGSLVPCSISSQIHREAEGQPKLIIGTMRDITERKRAEDKLRENENRMRLIVEGTPHLFFYTQDLEAKITYVSPSVVTITGHSIDEWHKSTDWFVTKNMINDYAKERTRAHLRGELSVGSILVEIEHADKHPILLEVYENPVVVDGTVIGVQGIAHDITERIHTENQLRKLSRAVEQSPTSIIITDLEGTIEYVNPKFTQVTGYSSAEALGQNPRILKSGELSAEAYTKMWDIITSGKEWQGEFHNKKKNGDLYWESASISPIKDASGIITHFLAVKEDITENKSLQTQLLRAQRMESLGTLAGGIAHDLNNVLAPLMLGLDVLKKKFTDESTQKIITLMEGGTLRGRDIIKQVLTFARGVEGDFIVLQPKHVVREMENIINETFPKSIKLHTDIQKDTWTINGDATQIHQVLLNLCVNARDAMSNHGELTLSTENLTLDENYARMNINARPGQYVCITVADTGIGIPPEIKNKIFDPFFTTKAIGKGTGLGLSVTHSIIKSHKGFINVYSELGKGTTIKVYFPAAATDENQKATPVIMELPAGNGETILVVDDEYSILDITKHTLLTYSYNVLTASDGTEAITMYAQHKDHIDLVMSDIMMPNLDGVTAARALRRMNPSLKIILTSGHKANDPTSPKIDFAIQAFLQKPYTAETLLNLLRKVLDRKNDGE